MALSPKGSFSDSASKNSWIISENEMEKSISILTGRRPGLNIQSTKIGKKGLFPTDSFTFKVN